jgi:predicted transcriptional regulator
MGARKTEILYQCNLSFTQCNSYLSFLLEKDVLEEKTIVNYTKSRDKYFKTTEKGHTLLDDINKILFYFK